MKVLKIIPDTIVDGPGLRTSVYFAGCSHNCEGCHNPESWNFEQGAKYTVESLFNKIKSLGNKKVTFTGGDPLYQNLQELSDLSYYLHTKGYNIWLYTGYTFEWILEQKYDKSCCELEFLLNNIDVIVDGPFIKDLKDTSLKFRGSSNQRLIDVKQSIIQNKIITI